MSWRFHAEVLCDNCDVVFVGSGDDAEDLEATVRLAAVAEGWAVEGDVMDLCPACTEIHDAAIEAWGVELRDNRNACHRC